MHPPSLTRRSMLAGALALALGGTVRAQSTYPAYPVNWYVGFPAGGGTDVLARTVGSQLGDKLKQSVIIDNLPGAAGMLAATRVAHQPPDGYNVLTGDIAILIFNPAIYSHVEYDPVKDFTPIALMARFPLIIAANPDSGIKTIQDFIAKSKSGNTMYGSAGIGTPHHLAMELLLSETGAKSQHIPYKGDAPAMQDLSGGQIPVAILAPAVVLPYIKTGKLVPLAVTADTPLAAIPNVPSLKQLDLTSRGVYAWQGLVGPRGMQPNVVDTLSGNIAAVMQDKTVIAKLADLGMEPYYGDSKTMGQYILSEQALWTPLIKARGITSTV